MATLTPTKAPNLIVFPPDYSAVLQNQLANQLRLYFNQIDNNDKQIIQQLGNLYVNQWLGEFL
jgi:hypothetical protein